MPDLLRAALMTVHPHLDREVLEAAAGRDEFQSFYVLGRKSHPPMKGIAR
jgi:hypothetical protein